MKRTKRNDNLLPKIVVLEVLTMAGKPIDIQALLNSGYSVTDVAGWLGHSSPVTTFGYYAHASKASKENISMAVQKWFNATD